MSNSFYILKIFVKDSPKTDNKYNKLILEFLNNNIEEIVSYGYTIRIILLNESNIDKFLKLKINNIPALLDEEINESVTGVENIIKYIIHKCNSSTDEEDVIENVKQTSNIEKMDSASYLRNYLLNEMASNDVIEDPIDLDKAKMYDDMYKKNKDIQLSKNTGNINKNLINTVKKNINSNSYNSSIENGMDDIDRDILNKNEITTTKKISQYINDNDEDSDAMKKYWENLETTSDN